MNNSQLPKPYSDSNLALNLEALAAAQPILAERLHWPVEADHVSFDDLGGAHYHLHSSAHCLSLGEGEIDAVLTGSNLQQPEQNANPELLVFGLGCGELVETMLRRFPASKITAWDRDPWLMRLFLMRKDWSAEIAGGRLHLCLGCDLFEEAGKWVQKSIVDHPLLTQVYACERQLLGEKLKPKRALVCSGGLYVDSLSAQLKSRGFSVYSFDVERLAPEELTLIVERFEPKLVATINYVGGLGEFCEGLNVDLLCWEIDPCTSELQPLSSPCDGTHIFTYRKSQVKAYRKAGFKHVEHTALAADTQLRRPLELSQREREQYQSKLAFVGSSLLSNLDSFRDRFNRCHAAWEQSSGRKRDQSELLQRAQESFEQVCAGQRADFSSWLVPDLLEARCPGLRTWAVQHAGLDDPAQLLGEIAGSEKRLSYMANLGRFDAQVWGDSGWNLIENHGVAYRGPAGHREELSRIYCAATINLDIGRLYQADIAPMRVFDIMACGGFVLAEWSPDLEREFEVGVELDCYRNLDQLTEKVEHYLAHPDQVRSIAERGYRAVCERHSFGRRVEHMLSSMEMSSLQTRVAG